MTDVDSESNEVDLTAVDGTEEIDFNPSQVLKSKVSYVWDFFVFRGTKEAGPDRSKVFCKLCPKGKKQKDGLKYLSATTNMSDHLKRHHKKEHEAAVKKNNNIVSEKDRQPSVSGYFSGSVVQKWPKTGVKWQKTTKALTKFVVKDLRPVSLVEGEGFQSFVKEISPEYEIPTKKTITNHMEKLYVEKKEKIVEELSETEFVALTTDGVSASNASSFQDTNVHFITENMELKSYVLAVKESKETHSAINYRKNTDDVAEEFGISEKIVKTVTDNEPKMNAAYSKEERTGCISHIQHKSWEKASTKVKVKVVQNIFNEDFKNCDAINEALQGLSWKASKKKGKKAKDKLEEYILSRSEMIKMKNLNKFLTKIDIYSTTLGGDKFVTSSIAMPVLKSMKKLLKPDDEDPSYIMELKEIMLEDFRERCADNIDGPFLCKDTALNPRFKNLKVVDGKENREAVFDILEAEAKALDDNPDVHVEEQEAAETRFGF